MKKDRNKQTIKNALRFGKITNVRPLTSSCYETCEWCAKEIAYGDAALTINRHIEHMDRTKSYPDGVVTVDQADVLLTLCAECGNALDVDALKHILAAPIRRPR